MAVFSQNNEFILAFEEASKGVSQRLGTSKYWANYYAKKKTLTKKQQGKYQEHLANIYDFTNGVQISLDNFTTSMGKKDVYNNGLEKFLKKYVDTFKDYYTNWIDRAFVNKVSLAVYGIKIDDNLSETVGFFAFIPRKGLVEIQVY